jgi:thiosulfate/3-mercaptopyruvate sulfurtransferase
MSFRFAGNGEDCNEIARAPKMRRMHTTIVTPNELCSHLQDASWAIIDCRADLARPEWGAHAYAEGHIPGAVHANLERDLSGEITRSTGRHPLPAPQRFAETLSRWGIDASTQVVAYDQGNSAYAARLWWMLRWMGHHAVAVLDGGFAAWQKAGLPISGRAEGRAPRSFVIQKGDQPVSTAELQDVLGRNAAALVDARASDRFNGRNETIDPVAGHVPGALNHPFAENLDENGHFRSAQELRKRWERTLAGRGPEETITMCGSGVTACHNLLALEIAGLPGARLYAGSWSEWIRDPSRPVDRGHS